MIETNNIPMAFWLLNEPTEIRKGLTVPIADAQGIVLCGGHGSRLKDITLDKPKHTVPITSSKIVLDYPTCLLRKAGVEEIILSSTMLAIDPIRSRTKLDEAYDGIRYNVAQEPKGVIDALGRCIEEYRINSPLIIAHGDEVITGANLNMMYHIHS